MASFFKQKIDFSDSYTMLKWMIMFSKSKETSLNAQEFDAMARSLLTDHDSRPNDLPVSMSADLFTAFDKNKDRKIDEAEFETVWKSWIRPLAKPVSALLIIDVQNDFIDGSLALKNCTAKQDGIDVVSVINNILGKVDFDSVVYSLDYHPENHISFYENFKSFKLSDKCDLKEIAPFNTVIFEGPPEVEQKLWPKHCVEDSRGSKLHRDLKIVENAIFIYKGMNPKVDSYSAFWDNMRESKTALHKELQKRGVTHVFVCGLATDYCVGYTALDALDLGYATILVENASRGTDNNNIEKMKKKLLSKLCLLISSDEIENLVNGTDVRSEFAYVLGKRFDEKSDCTED